MRHARARRPKCVVVARNFFYSAVAVRLFYAFCGSKGKKDFHAQSTDIFIRRSFSATSIRIKYKWLRNNWKHRNVTLAKHVLRKIIFSTWACVFKLDRSAISLLQELYFSHPLNSNSGIERMLDDKSVWHETIFLDRKGKLFVCTIYKMKHK